jgi:hypothetical protein
MRRAAPSLALGGGRAPARHGIWQAAAALLESPQKAQPAAASAVHLALLARAPRAAAAAARRPPAVAVRKRAPEQRRQPHCEKVHRHGRGHLRSKAGHDARDQSLNPPPPLRAKAEDLETAAADGTVAL